MSHVIPERFRDGDDAVLAAAVRDHLSARAARDLPEDVRGELRSALLASLANAAPPTMRSRFASSRVRWLIGVSALGGSLLALWPPAAPRTEHLADDTATASPAARVAPMSLLPAAPRVAGQLQLPRTSRSSTGSAETAPVVAAVRDVSGELALLRAARRALAATPLLCLQLVDEHAARYAAGMFVQERELLRIEALAALARGPEFRQRAADFRHNFPDSSHLTRIGVLLELHDR